MAEIKDPENTILMELKDGTVTIELLPDVAPKHVERMKELTRAGAYDNVCFHRVIDGFMAQTGDVQFGMRGGDTSRAGTGASDMPDLAAEFSNIPFKLGTVGAARSASPDSANSQFFIVLGPSKHLNGKYTVFGQVTEGLRRSITSSWGIRTPTALSMIPTIW